MPSSTRSSASYYELFERKIQALNNISEKYKCEICSKYLRGRAVNISYSLVRDFLVSHKVIEGKLYEVKKKLEDQGGCGSFAIVGEWGEGKSQLAYFLYYELRSSNYHVELLDAADHDFEDRLRELVYEQPHERVCVLVDGIDSLAADPKRWNNLALNLLPSISQYIEKPRGNRRVAVIPFLTMSNYLSLNDKMGGSSRRLDKIDITDLVGEGSGDEVSAEIALNVLAALHYCDDRIRELLERGKEEAATLFAEFARAYFSHRGGKVVVGEYINTFATLFRDTLQHINKLEALDSVNFGSRIEAAVKEILCGRTFHFGTAYTALVKCSPKQRPGPDFTVNIYHGSLPQGAVLLTVQGEIKAMSSRELSGKVKEQLESYLASGPLVLLLFADFENAEDLQNAIESQFRDERIRVFTYSSEFLRPLILVEDPRAREKLLESVFGKSLLQDLSIACEMLLEQPRKPSAPGSAPDIKAAARKWVEKSKLCGGTTHQKNYKDMLKYLVEVNKAFRLELPVSEGAEQSPILDAILDKLLKANYLMRKSNRRFEIVPQTCREKGMNDAVSLVAEVLEAHQAGGPSKFII